MVAAVGPLNLTSTTVSPHTSDVDLLARFLQGDGLYVYNSISYFGRCLHNAKKESQELKKISPRIIKFVGDLLIENYSDARPKNRLEWVLHRTSFSPVPAAVENIVHVVLCAETSLVTDSYNFKKIFDILIYLDEEGRVDFADVGRFSDGADQCIVELQFCYGYNRGRIHQRAYTVVLRPDQVP